MEAAIELWKQMQQGVPPWVDGDTHTIRFGNTIARQLASLITEYRCEDGAGSRHGPHEGRPDAGGP